MRNLKGNRLPRSPKWSVNFNLSQVIEVPSGSFDWLVNFTFRAKHFLTAYNGVGIEPKTGEPVPSFFDKVNSYVNIDIGVGYSHGDDGRIRVEGYVTNITQETHATSQLSDAFNFNRWYNPPRTYGVRVRLKI